MLEVSHVSKTFNPSQITERRALKDVSLKMNDGDFVTVIGGNGAGKSTLLNLIAGVHSCDSGSILLDGKDLTHVKEHKRARYLGRVFQDPMLGTCSNMQIEENLALAYRRGKQRTLAWGVTAKERVLFKEALAKLELGLEDRMTAKVGLLSGGQRQALTLLMAVLQKPQLLLLDEHTAALDPKTAKKVLELTEFFVQRDGLTTFMVTHNMRDAIRYGNRLIMMLDGKIVYEVSGEEKKKLEVKDLLERFSVHQGEDSLSDKMLLS
ncbi:MAG: ABC transporter ATP-binding protein [Treponema sp.]|nr:ABC transporter ATP-binding protein [Treponema sp.]